MLNRDREKSSFQKTFASVCHPTQHFLMLLMILNQNPERKHFSSGVNSQISHLA